MTEGQRVTEMFLKTMKKSIKWTTEIIYIDEISGEIITETQFKNYYYEIKREKRTEHTNRGNKIVCTIIGRPNGQQTFKFE